MGLIGRLLSPKREEAGIPAAERLEQALAAHKAGDTRKALSLWAPLAEAGEPRALNALGAERDAATAAGWWRKAADLGHTEAQAMLGAAHFMGRGVDRNIVSALVWLYRAQRGRSEVAASFIPQGEAAATDEQREEAANLAAVAGGAP